LIACLIDLTPLLGVTPFEFLDEPYTAKTRVFGLSIDEDFLIPSLRRFDTVPACDRQADGQTKGQLDDG